MHLRLLAQELVKVVVVELHPAASELGHLQRKRKLYVAHQLPPVQRRDVDLAVCRGIVRHHREHRLHFLRLQRKRGLSSNRNGGYRRFALRRFDPRRFDPRRRLRSSNATRVRLFLRLLLCCF